MRKDWEFLEMILYGRQHITQEDIDSVISCLNSDYLTQGPQIEKFEQSVSKQTGAQYGVAVTNATAALHIACLALDLGPGDWVWTSPNTFVASANSALYCGASIDFVDIDPCTYNLCAIKLEEKLIVAAQIGKLPKIVIPVHLTGQPCDMASIHALSKKYDFKIIEDASHAIGAMYKGEPIGNCRYSDITVFSFHPVKIITTGEGGMAVTNNAKLANLMYLLRSHGITRDEALMTEPKHGAWYYQQIILGFNYRMTDIQAALGISQLTRLTKYVERRQEIARKYSEYLADLPLLLPWQHPYSSSSYHLYVIRLHLDRIRTTHLQVFNALRGQEIMVNLHYIPIHLQPYFRKMGFKEGDFPEAEKYYREALSIPMHFGLSEDDLQDVASTLRSALIT
jgi:UDP-4-amino-4,6-dideoxy-N-acetyl-beta-L-altrosamine transaminase